MKEKIAKYSAIYCVVVMITIAIIAYAGRHFIILVLPVTALLSFPFSTGNTTMPSDFVSRNYLLH